MSQFRAAAGVVGAAGAGVVVSMFSATPALDTNDANQGNSFRVLCDVGASSRSLIRATIQPGTANSLTVTHASIGKWAGDANYSDTTGTPIELKFGGASGFAGATSAQTSDWTDISSLSLAPGEKVVVIYDVLSGAAATASQRYNNAASNATTFYQSIESWNIASTAGRGFNLVANTNYCIASVETKGAVRAGVNGSNPAHEPPLSFEDGIFTSMIESAAPIILSSGQNLSHRSIEEFSGNPTITCRGSNTLSYCRVNSRECIRITDNDLLIDHCYLEATGEGEDHADTLQAYSPGARGGTVTISNTHIRAHATAATAGFFIADNWGGSVVLQDVIIQGGPWGLRFMADGADINISLSNVYFIGPFGAEGGPYSFEDYNGGTHAILQWDNVREATIVDGELVLGDALPQP